MTQDELFVVCLRALQGPLSELVLVGAWANRFYQFHEIATFAAPVSPRLMTVDVDFAIENGGVTGSLRERMAERNFRESVRGEASPPATKYHPPTVDTDDGFYVEFVTPLQGGPVSRGGKVTQTTVVSGVVAWQLRDIDVLLRDSWAVHLDASFGLPIDGTGIDVRVAAPERYILQKILSIPHRSTPHKKAKDVLYLCDMFVTFGLALGDLAEPFEAAASEHLKPGRKSKMLKQLADMPLDRRLIARARRIGIDAGRPITQMDRIGDVLRAGADQLLR